MDATTLLKPGKTARGVQRKAILTSPRQTVRVAKRPELEHLKFLFIDRREFLRFYAAALVFATLLPTIVVISGIYYMTGAILFPLCLASGLILVAAVWWFVLVGMLMGSDS
jgi:hypothetical protein